MNRSIYPSGGAKDTRDAFTRPSEEEPLINPMPKSGHRSRATDATADAAAIEARLAAEEKDTQASQSASSTKR